MTIGGFEMTVETTRFGSIEVDENTLITMPSGLPGFEKRTRFCLVRHRAGQNFQWLQSVEEPGLAFVVVDPSGYFESYEVEIGDSDVERLGLEDARDALVLAIVTIRNGGAVITANLAAPIVINSKNNIGAQVVLQNELYTTQHALIVRPAAHQAAAAKAA
jgi:flagellar assembly factor FliW